MEESKTMVANKTPGSSDTASDEQTEATAADLEEFETVSAELDNLNTVLDKMENNVDSIKDQLISILMSNREILKELKEENEKSEQPKDGEGSSEASKPMDSSD